VSDTLWAAIIGVIGGGLLTGLLRYLLSRRDRLLDTELEARVAATLV
jgi:hypothetical protein